MGPQGCILTFPGKPPTPAELAREAARLGGLAIISPATATGTSLAFEDFPHARVSISYPDPHQLFIIDDSLSAPALFRLVAQAAHQLGGITRPDATALPAPSLPLAHATIRKETRRA